MSEDTIIENKRYNKKIFPFYKAISWDLLFFYAISFLFLTGTKGLSASNVLFLDAFYPIFKVILQIPDTMIINKIGNRKSIILGNILVCSAVLTIILAKSMPVLILYQFLSAFGYSLKNLTETNFLFSSIEKTPERNDKFSRIDGKGSTYYYIIDAITSLVTGYLFVINGYLPMITCFVICMFSTFLSLKFKDILVENNTKKITIKKNLLDIRDGFKFIFQSNRLKSLITFLAIFDAVLAMRTSLQSSILTDIKLPEQYFGIIYAVAQVIAAIATNKQQWFHNRFKNRTLTAFSLTFCFSFITIGLSQIINLNFGLSLEIILIMLAVQCAVKGPYYTFEKRYLNSFASSSMRTKIYACEELVYCAIKAGICFVCSALLNITTTAYVYIILGCIFTVIFIFLLDHMKHTVGLKPEEYPEKDIKFVEMH